MKNLTRSLLLIFLSAAVIISASAAGVDEGAKKTATSFGPVGTWPITKGKSTLTVLVKPDKSVVDMQTNYFSMFAEETTNVHVQYIAQCKRSAT